jgi:hypothetical protein
MDFDIVSKTIVEFTDTADKLLILEFDINETNDRILSITGDRLRT